MTVYLDCNATTPLDRRVRASMLEVLDAELGNAGSPHEFGERAKSLVHRARDQVARVVGARRHEVVFTSGATESNNLAILGLRRLAIASQRRHLVSTQIEHKAVLEPLFALQREGFDLTLVPPTADGQVNVDDLLAAVRDDTLLVSVMHVNNETGIVQPVAEIAERLSETKALFHVDAAQGYGRDLESLRHPRVDMISVSGHKIHGPQGIGALIVRRHDGQLPPLEPVLLGGGQELGLRSGTLPNHLIAGFGYAAELAMQECLERQAACRRLRAIMLEWLEHCRATIHGHERVTLPHVINASLPSFSADQLMDAWRGVLAVSDGAACTTVCASPSHVLSAMGVREPELSGAVRFSWCHLTDEQALRAALQEATRRLATLST